MNSRRGWSAYPMSYCAREMKLLSGWIQQGTSGAVVGPAGVGKSNLLGFLCHRPDALALYGDTKTNPAALIFVDLNDLPAFDPATLYRLIVRVFYESRQQFTPDLRERVKAAYQETRTSSDAFTVQTALRELLFLFQEQSLRVVLVLDRFDYFCQHASHSMTDSLRALRDGFKETVCYLVGMRQEIAYLSDPALLGELYELLDAHVCRVQPLTLADAHYLASRELAAADPPPDQDTVDELVRLTGGYPAWLKIACSWWMNSPAIPFADWPEALSAEHTIQHRMRELWENLSQVEQRALSDVQSGMQTPADVHPRRTKPGKKADFPDINLVQLRERRRQTLALLEAKGLIQREANEWRIFSPLLTRYIAALSGGGRGQIWHDSLTGGIYQGQVLLEHLTPLESSLLTYLLTHPRIRHTYTSIIQGAWPDEVNKVGVSNEALFQVVTGLRRKIEPDPSKPCYLVNWRGIPEGGYQCFPEGRPA